jgi:hypothetical protein
MLDLSVVIRSPLVAVRAAAFGRARQAVDVGAAG